jgi:glycosyltransferase involved in cell wall biosynthesis
MSAQPLISVITVVYNGESVILPTLQSVLSQSLREMEYIIIDGASKDKTLEIIDPYRSQITHLTSEPDKGLYDAMNKGLKLATGRFVLFMNAGDRFYSPLTLEEMFANEAARKADVVYGETMMVNEAGEELGLRSERLPLRLPEHLAYRSMQRGMVVCHQSFAVRRELAGTYDTSWKYCADVDWVIRCLKTTSNIYRYPGIVCRFLEGGLSRKKLKGSLKERYQVLKKHFGFWPNLFNHGLIVLRSVWFIVKRGKLY